jgi:hypothetical protein
VLLTWIWNEIDVVCHHDVYIPLHEVVVEFDLSAGVRLSFLLLLREQLSISPSNRDLHCGVCAGRDVDFCFALIGNADTVKYPGHRNRNINFFQGKKIYYNKQAI